MEQTKTKSYTERFIEMEQAIGKMSYVINYHTNVITDLFGKIELLETVRNTVSAMMALASENKPCTIENVTRKIVQLGTEQQKKQLEQDLADQILLPVDTISDKSHIVAFETIPTSASPEAEYGQGSVSSFPEDMVSFLMEKKVGDIVQDSNGESVLKILGIYVPNQAKINGESNEEATAKEEDTNQKAAGSAEEQK